MFSQHKRPGGELASRPLHVIWIADCSRSMSGDRIGAVNYAIRQAIPDMRKAADENPNAQLLVRTLRFSTGAQWMTAAPEDIHAFGWHDLAADGVTDLGKALTLLAEQLRIPPMSERALPPVLVLLSDGQPTDDYKSALRALGSVPWWSKAVRIAISMGQGTDHDVLADFTGNRELILQANNSPDLVKMIKWASTNVAKMVSAPSSRTAGDAPVVIDVSTIPQPSDDGDVW